MNNYMCLFALAAISSQPLSQHVRAPIEPGEADLSLSRVEIESVGGLSAAVWADPEYKLMLSWSDGRGLSWSSVRVDEDSTGSIKSTNDSSIAIVGSTIYVAWTDSRFGQRKVFVNGLNRKTGDLIGEIQVPSPFLPISDRVFEFRLAASESDGVEYVYVIRATDRLDGPPIFGPEVYLSVLQDQTGFAAPVRLSPASTNFPPLGFNAGNVGIAARGNSVWVAWGDSRFTDDEGRDLFFNYSSEAGAPGSFLPADIMLSDSLGHPLIGVEGDYVSIDVMEESVAVAWSESEPKVPFDGNTGQDLKLRVSPNGGTEFDSTVVLKDSAANWRASDGQVRFASNGDIVASWEYTPCSCGALPGDHCGDVFARVSLDGGLTFLPEVQLSDNSLTAAYRPDLAVNSSLPDVVVSWAMFDESDQLDLFVPQARHSTDGGVTWGPVIEVESDPDGVGAADAFGVSGVWQAITINDLYRNVIAIWRVLGPEPKLTRIGGFRPQTLTPNGWSEGNATVNFDLARFDPESDPMTLVLVSAALGNAMAPDRRNLGLMDDGLFGLSLQLLSSGLTSAVILPDGTGSTTEFPITLPVGLTLYAVGAGFDMSGGSVEVGSITDVVEIPIGVPGG